MGLEFMHVGYLRFLTGAWRVLMSGLETPICAFSLDISGNMGYPMNCVCRHGDVPRPEFTGDDLI
jgi:hypothetical protein